MNTDIQKLIGETTVYDKKQMLEASLLMPIDFIGDKIINLTAERLLILQPKG